MIKVDNLKELLKYGFKDNIERDKCYAYDCGDNRTYVVVGSEDHELFISPEYIGDMAARYYDFQLDIIAILLLDGVARYEKTKKE